MPLDNVIQEDVPSFDLGLENSQVFGNLKAADAFLSESAAVTSDADELEDKDTPPKPEPKKEVKPTVKEVKTLSQEELAEKLLGGDEEEEEKVEDEKVEDEEQDSNQFEVLSKELYASNVFTKEEGEEEVVAKTPEEFLDLFNKEKEKGAQIWLENFLARFGDDRRELFEAIYINGVDPDKYLPVYNEVINFEELDLAEESNQESVIRTYYTGLGWDKAKIDAKIEKLKGYADLEDEAKTIHPQLVNQRKQELEAQVEANKAKLAQKEVEDLQYKTSIAKILQEKAKIKDLKGLPLTEADATKVFDHLYNKKWKTQTGETLTDFDRFILETKKPENHELRAAISW